MKSRFSRRKRTLGALGLSAFTAVGCAEYESLDSVRSSADARIPSAHPAPHPDESVEQLLGVPLTAESATRVALLNNRRVLAAYEELGIAHAAVVDTLRAPNPELQGAIRFSDKDPEIELFALLGLSELLFLPMRSDAAHAELEATRGEVVARIVALAFDTRNAFYDYQAALQELELSRTVLHATEASADAAEGLHEAGNLTDLDLANQRAFSEEARVAARRADTRAAEARSRLSALLGVADNANWSAAGRLADPPAQELPLEALEGRAVSQSFALASAQKRADAANQRASAEGTARFLPGLKAGVSARREGHWAVGPALALEVPLFYQGQGKVDAAEGEERRQKDLGVAGAVNVRNGAHAAASRLVAARENALRYRDVLLPLRKRVLDETELQYNAMTVGVFQLLAAKRDQIETARTYVELLRDYWFSRNEVERIQAGGARVAE